AARHVFERVALVALPVAPAKAAALIDRVDRVDEDETARQRQAAVPAALAEAADQIGFGKAGETLADKPVHQVQAGGKFHAPYYAAQSARVKAFSSRLDACGGPAANAHAMRTRHKNFMAPRKIMAPKA